ncbi:MAG TPA: MFS transporter [Candidatus Glassbacteria bacterium]|nr:MFS transporter [Candidatus Glassbacteria bacterium]
MSQLDRKAVFGWSMYDWANSAFATTVMAGILPVFFDKLWSTDVDPVVSLSRWGYANSLGGIIVAVMAPVLGAIADRGSAKKKFLIFFAFLGVLMTSALYLVAQGNWLLALGLYVMGVIGFSGANIFYDSLLPSVAGDKKMDFVSALGYSLGYLGGGLLFAANVWMVAKPELFGFPDTSEAVRFAFVTVGIWWAVFSLPLILFVKEPRFRAPEAGIGVIKGGIKQLKNTFQEIRHLKTIFLFLIAYWLYIDGVDTIIRMATKYGDLIHLDPNFLIIALLIVQFVGFPAAIAFGWLGERIGAKRLIFFAIGVYLFVSAWAAFMDSEREFLVLAILIGLVQGGIQALSRSYYARIIPVDKAAEYFGFYNMLGKFAVMIGPALISSVGLGLKYLGLSDDTALRGGIASVSLLFLAGGIVLYFVDEEKGREEARYLSEVY